MNYTENENAPFTVFGRLLWANTSASASSTFGEKKKFRISNCLYKMTDN